ncbi:HNH endonuclease [Pseudomonas plecoglossicida]|uniref:HNH endonuclease n=1 Tax=Pseudomonas plecoglossicida TaxID=70775 RepID=UPI0015E48044|nr:HNH endonuclease signature motif containing protein [Pseudomonas plecoglossicida]MBA1195745.1 HNH endonuclease [Pseudomonas plecoglossicida]
MAKLPTLKSRLQPVQGRKIATTNTSERRMTGSRLQARRLRLWTASPRCAACGRIVDYPSGFELDHCVPLHQGGADTDDNCQILCCGPDGCHLRKTVVEATEVGVHRSAASSRPGR